MASENGSPDPSSFIESLINSRARDISRFLPYFLDLTAAGTDQEVDDQGYTPDRVVLVNPITQGMVVIERRSGNSEDASSSLGFDSFFNDLFSSKGGLPPASKASIDAMETVEIVGSEISDGDQCAVCLEEWVDGEKVKEMPCKHRFHGGCIEKWLGIHGSCPVCRYEMPVEVDGGEKRRRSGEGDGDRRREIWVSFTFGRHRRDEASHTDGSSTADQELQD